MSPYETITDRINKVSERLPDKIAIGCGEEAITYSELSKRSTKIAGFLQTKIHDNTNVSIYMDKGIDLITSILAVMKGGGIFVTIDPAFPADRSKTIIDQVESDWIITHSAYVKTLDEIMGTCNRKINVLIMDMYTVGEENVEHLNIYPLSDLKNQPLNSIEFKEINKHCYIYFTSGSTGQPKGVLGRHKSLKQFIDWEIDEFKVDENVKVSQLTQVSFDPFLRDIFVPLCAGGTLCIPENRDIVLDTVKLIKWIEQSGVSLIHMVPSLFRILTSVIADSNTFSKVNHILLAGELLRGSDLKDFFKIFGDRIKLVNLYGPTETTLAKLFYRIAEEDRDRHIIPVGKPISSAQVMVLNQDLQKSFSGSIGEVYIRTPYISSGYLNDRDLTKQVFIQNPFSKNPQDIIYKTGDVGRFLPDGNLEISGRSDSQIKIRGIRIEPGEIENQILQYKGIKEATVIAREDQSGSKYICAYIVSAEQFEIAELKKYLSKRLADFMIPSYFVRLNELPLNTNGKVNRKALPSPEWSEVNVEYAAPIDHTEEKLVEIWEEIFGVRPIGIDHNFFEMGGHSLRVTSLIAKVHQEFFIDLPFKEVFKLPTIRELADFVRYNIKIKSDYSIKSALTKKYYALSSAQKRMFVMSQFDQNSVSYNMPNAVLLEGELDQGMLESLFDSLIKRHETLRTNFCYVDGTPMQYIQDSIDFSIQYKDLSKENIEHLDDLIRKFIKPFDLATGPLFRVELMKLAQNQNMLLLDMHHIISDGVSVGILLRELMHRLQGKDLPELTVQYKDYVEWHDTLMQSGRMEEQEQYWLSAFSDEIPVLNFPLDYPRPLVQDYEGSTYVYNINKETFTKLTHLTSITGTTTYMMLLATLNILLSKYANQEDIIVGTPISGRHHHPDLNNIIGVFVNTLAMRNYPAGDKSFTDFLNEVKNNALEAYENQDYQFEEFVDKLGVRRDLARNPLFDVMFVVYNGEQSKQLSENVNLKPYQFDKKIAKFDITLTGVQTSTGVELTFEYSTKLFKKDTIERLATHYNHVLNQILENPNVKLSEIGIISDFERHQILYEFNRTEVEFPQDKTITKLFEEQVEKTPDNVALIYREKKMTYREVNARSNQLAYSLRENGLTNGKIVAIMMDRSFEMIIGILGILKAGGAYVPISPETPSERVQYMIDNCEINLLLGSNFRSYDCFQKVRVLHLKDEGLYSGSDANLDINTNPESLAYVIYTSGSTGDPKGVMVEHRSVINRLNWIQRKYPIGENDVILQKTPFTFDVSVGEIFWFIMNGAALCLPKPGDEKDPDEIIKVVEREKVTTIHFVPAMLNIFLEYLNNTNQLRRLSSLKYVFTSGEALSVSQVNTYNQLIYSKLDIPLVNLYGPTEATVEVSYFDCRPSEVLSSIPIGKPIDNINLLVVDNNNKLNPIGVPGELCISGVGVARGYMKSPELTAQKFTANPFIGSTTHQRMYRTGDLAKWNSDGNIEYLGRMDNQVKIKGFRIELGEIEAKLLNLSDINEAVVLARDDGSNEKYLCAYVVANKEVNIKELKNELSAALPVYMIPSYIIHLEEMPLNQSGKIDRKILPKPDKLLYEQMEYEPPTNKIQEKLLEIWKEVLDVKHIGITHNFFSLGGESIKAIQILARLQKDLLKFDIKDLFIHPTIQELSKYIRPFDMKIDQGMVTGDFKPTPIQKWMFEREYPEVNHWSFPVMIYKKDGFNKEIVKKVMNKIIQHHDALRSIFKIIDGNYSVSIRPYQLDMFEFNEVELQASENYVSRIEHEANKMHSKMDLMSGHLVKVKLFHTTDGDHLLFVIHHSIMDGISLRILLEDFKVGYEQLLLNNGEVKLQNKTTSYKEWSEKLSVYAQSEELLNELEYWANVERTYVKSFQKDGELSSNKVKDGNILSITLSVETTSRLIASLKNTHDAEINDLLLTVLALSFKEWANVNCISVFLEGHGREEIINNVDIKRTVGWFTSIYPVILDVSEEGDFDLHLGNIKNYLRAVPNKGVGYGILKYLTPAHLKHELQFYPKPEIYFNFLGQFDQGSMEGVLEESPYSVGQDLNPNLERLSRLNITGIINSGSLEININYNKNEYLESSIKKLLSIYESNLNNSLEKNILIKL